MKAKPPPASSPQARLRMQTTRRRDTATELDLRRELHRRGLRYRVDFRPLPNSRRRADIVFPRLKIAVFCDGCYWHGCPEHGTWPKENGQWWRDKIAANKERDLDTDARLREAGWLVIRIWEHEDPTYACEYVVAAVERARRSPSRI